MSLIVICDDHRIFGQALSAVLRAHGYDVVACTSDPDSGLAAVAHHRPDLYVVDLYFPGGSSLERLTEVEGLSPGTRTVIVSGSCDPHAVEKARQAGAAAFVAKDRPIEEILTAISDVLQGRSTFHMAASRPCSLESMIRPDEPLLRCLTPRERQVLEGLVQGQDTPTLARSLGVTYSTARTHIQSLVTKLGVHSKLEAVALVTSATS